MDKKSKIYIAGHEGFVGSAIVRKLNSLGYENLVLRTHKQLDLIDFAQTEQMFISEKPEYVFLAAAKVGGIYANNTYPAEFIFQNISIQTNIIHLAHRYNVKKLLFLASSCSYPKLCRQPMKEEYLLTGELEPTNKPFAVAKIAGITMCQSYNRQYGTNFISIIPSNTYGINEKTGQNAHVVPAFFSKFMEAKAQAAETVSVWGTGNQKREFIYVDDLADACVFLMNNYDSSQVINVGSGIETSINELAHMTKHTTGFTGRIEFDTTKPDGNPRRFLDSGKIKALGWEPKITLEHGMQLTYDYLLSLQS